MEKFILLFRGSDVYLPGQAPEALEALRQKMLYWLTELTNKGIHVASEPFEPVGKQVIGANMAVADRPFGEVWEIIGGCTIIKAKHIDEAIEIAKSCPILTSNANIEIRPIQNIQIQAQAI